MGYGPKKDRSPLTRLKRLEQRLQQKQIPTDNRRFRFGNNTSGELALPKPSEDGKRSIPVDGNFIGDGYFLCMVPQLLVILEDLQMEKLITEQPPIVTTKGKVEYVVEKPAQKLNESKPGKQEDVLLTEDPVGGIAICE